MLCIKSTLISALALILALALASVVSAQKIVTIKSKSKFCLLLPPRGGLVNDTEAATSYCTQSGLSSPQLFPTDFIVSANYKKNYDDNWIQITGRFDRCQHNLSIDDKGGQYDSVNPSPSGSLCKDYDHYVEILEPDVEHYCLRCCQNKSDCPTNKGDLGCEKALGGIY
ncbi:hypothetical protein BGZ65_010872 [Modicella reniformis]|uniref:Uncharacterized protein n=1 Tax=Modicella reniformis TaxID=1440133 RepID=A0A9P6LUV9_9FUNG|nr:hypothetical protein BGZ65_010872 [Modicella reniformis]